MSNGHPIACECTDCSTEIVEGAREALGLKAADCNCQQALNQKRRLEAVKRIAEGMENSSGSPMIKGETEHHLKHWAQRIREALS